MKRMQMKTQYHLIKGLASRIAKDTKQLLRTLFLTVFTCSIFLFYLHGIWGRAHAEVLSGESIYKDRCASCHEGGFKGWISGAPDVGAPLEWELFRKKGLPSMIRNTLKGTEHMDPKGGCGPCTRGQIEAAVRYIDSQLNKGSDNDD